MKANTINKLIDRTSWTWYILTVVYLLYLGQSTFFPSLAIVGQLLIFLILFVGLINLIRSLRNYTSIPNCEKLIILMLVILTLTYVISPKMIICSWLPFPIITLNQFKQMVAFFLPIFTGYQIGLHKRLTSKQWFVISIILLILAINSFLISKQQALILRGQEESTNNSAYIFLYILPFLPLILNKYRIMAFTILAICFIFVMLGAKRGAIVCMGFMILYLMWWYLKRKRVSLGTIIAILVVIAALIIGLNYFFTTDDYLQTRLEQTIEGNSSHRDVLYSMLWEEWLDADLSTQLFGRGIAQTITVVGNYAHNDWLELLTDVGLFGAVVYLMIIVSLLKFRKKFHKNSPEQAAFTVVILFWFLKTIFSMGMEIMGGISMMLLGTLIGNVFFNSNSVLHRDHR